MGNSPHSAKPQDLKFIIFRILFIPELDNKAQNLSMMSAKYKKDASSLNATSWAAIGAGGFILFLVFFVWYKFLL